MGDPTMLSRSGKTNADGKLTMRIDVPVSEDLHDAVAALATLAGVPKSEFVRCALERLCFGELPIARRLMGYGAQKQSEEYPSGGCN